MKTCAYCGQPSEDDATRCAGCGLMEFQSDAAAASPSPPPAPTPAPPAVQVVSRTLTSEEESLAFVTLCTCRSIEEADLIATKLQSVGIDATIPDEYLQQAVAWNLNTYGLSQPGLPTTRGRRLEILRLRPDLLGRRLYLAPCGTIVGQTSLPAGLRLAAQSSRPLRVTPATNPP